MPRTSQNGFFLGEGSMGANLQTHLPDKAESTKNRENKLFKWAIAFKPSYQIHMTNKRKLKGASNRWERNKDCPGNS